MKTKVRFFVSYAHRNQALAVNFLDHFLEYTGASLKYDYHLWRDTTNILVGENWDDEIKTAAEQCDIGLLLISASFLGSRYITRVELRQLRSKPVIPVLLWPIDFERFDLKGLQRKQIFRLNSPRFQEPKSYGDCNTKQRNKFILKLFRQVERRLDRLNLS